MFADSLKFTLQASFKHTQSFTSTHINEFDERFDDGEPYTVDIVRVVVHTQLQTVVLPQDLYQVPLPVAYEHR